MPKNRPAKPAMHSGPGALSQRTDGGPHRAIKQMIDGTPAEAIGTYGDKAALQRVQQTVAPAPAGSPGGGSAPGGPPPAPSVPGLFDPTMRPGEPLTAGAALGPGAGPTNAPLMRDTPDHDVIRAMLIATGGHPNIVRLARRAGVM